MVTEADTYEMNAVTLEDGQLDAVTDSAQTNSFNQGFSSTPVVLVTVASTNEADAVVGLINYTTAAEFKVKFQEQESTRFAGLDSEEVNYLAFSGGGIIEANGELLEVSTHLSGNVVTDAYTTVILNVTDVPLLFADIQTKDGNDISNVRYQNLTALTVEWNVDKEQSYDSEIAHTTKVVGVVPIVELGVI
ncbi:MAG: hypothetical protein MI864_12345 [Pseudomonadales bacterium]|nr:hypothetical protein [Pseudomonadales bacterium]